MQAYQISLLPDKGYLNREAIDEIYHLSHKAKNAINDILDRTGLEIWEAKLDDESFDPWTLVPYKITQTIRDKYPKENQEERRRRELLVSGRKKEYSLPLDELASIREKQYETLGRWGLLYFDGNSEEGGRMLRTALRGTLNRRLKSDIRTALQKMIRNSRDENEFEKLFELSGFYVSEVGLKVRGDSFRDEFRTSLQYAAKNFRERSEMKYIFILTLLAEGYPDETSGRQARKEAIDLAFKVAAREPLDDRSDDTYPTSNLGSLSVVRVDNSTQYHLLSLYDGPERFFVHCNPYRKGSLVLKNGTYQVAVITTTGNIRPYQAKLKLTSAVKESNYYIEKGGAGNQTNFTPGSSAYGEYKLLRSPNNEVTFMVDARNGSVAMTQ